MYICEICKKKPATVHLTNIENNVKKELHMCEHCAESKGFSLKQAIHLPNFIGEVAKAAPVKPKARRLPDLTCEACGMTWKEFRKVGRFGCANDYVAFRAQIEEMLGDMHARGARHVGKTPPGTGLDVTLRREVLECRRKLREAVDSEKYEEAAALRDRLAEMQKTAGEKS